MNRQNKIFWIGLCLVIVTLGISAGYPVFYPDYNTANSSISASPPLKQFDFEIHYLSGSTIEKKNYSMITSEHFSGIHNDIPPEYAQYLCNFSGNYSSIIDIALKDKRVQKNLMNGGILEGISYYEPPCHAVLPTGNPVCQCSSPTLRIQGPAMVNAFNKNRVKEYADYLVDEKKGRVEGIMCHYTDVYSPDSTYVQFCTNDCDSEICSDYPTVQHTDDTDSHPLTSKSMNESTMTQTSASVQRTAHTGICPDALTTPPEEFLCPRNMPSLPATYRVEDPEHPTSKDYASIPVDFPGADRTSLITIALRDKCVRAFLESGGEIEGISDQPRPFRKNEDVRWPPAMYGYRRINCTEMLVQFDLDPDAGNVSRIMIDVK